jgi:hypothetical protein
MRATRCSGFCARGLKRVADRPVAISGVRYFRSRGDNSASRVLDFAATHEEQRGDRLFLFQEYQRSGSRDVAEG